MHCLCVVLGVKENEWVYWLCIYCETSYSSVDCVIIARILLSSEAFTLVRSAVCEGVVIITSQPIGNWGLPFLVLPELIHAVKYIYIYII